MNYDKILADEDTPVPMGVGDQNGTYRPKSGTTVRLIDFLPKRVPDPKTFHRQMARRFGLRQNDFNVIIEDTRNPKRTRVNAKSRDEVKRVGKRPVRGVGCVRRARHKFIVD